MDNYYAKSLNANKLAMVYDTKIGRIEQYLQAEIAHVQKALTKDMSALEVGAGYGRIIRALAPHAGELLGIDISHESVELSKRYLSGLPHCSVLPMDVYDLPYVERFDRVLCLQNGLSALKGDLPRLFALCLRAVKPGGAALFSTYSEKFWDVRLQWFYEQAEKGLLGEIDPTRTKDGVIVCKDGFEAISFSISQLEAFGQRANCRYTIEEVDGSSVFLTVYKD